MKAQRIAERTDHHREKEENRKRTRRAEKKIGQRLAKAQRRRKRTGRDSQRRK
jgi:hypothetical protein